MSHALEIVHIRVLSEREEALLATRPAAVEAMRAFAGFRSAHLAQIEGERWIDVVLWRSREEATAAAERAPSIPALARHFENIAEVLSMEHAEVRDEATV